MRELIENLKKITKNGLSEMEAVELRRILTCIFQEKAWLLFGDSDRELYIGEIFRKYGHSGFEVLVKWMIYNNVEQLVHVCDLKAIANEYTERLLDAIFSVPDESDETGSEDSTN